MDEETAEDRAARSARPKNPVIYVGGGIVLAKAAAELNAFVDAMAIPVAHSLMGKGALPDDHPLTLGMIGLLGHEVQQR